MPELLDIVGQETALVRIQQALAAARVPQALLFVGPEGVGRRTTAVAMAKTLLCENVQSSPNAGRLADLPADFPLRSACGRCTSCRTVGAGTSGDFRLVYKELARYHQDADVRGRVMQELGIDVVRDFLITPAWRSPAGAGKVFVVLEAELMSVAAQNSLLKTLEEPPPGVTIILICRRAAELLPTTLSRCWMVNFHPLPIDFVRDRLAAAGVAAAEAAYWAAYTDGALGAALRLAEQGMYAVKRDLLARTAAPAGGDGAELADYLAKAADKLAGLLVAEVKQQDGADLSRQLAGRRAAAAILAMLAGFFRDAVTVASGAERPLVNADQAGEVRALAKRFNAVELAKAIEQLGECERLLWRNVNARLVWDNVAVTICSAQPLRL